jgi:hypothetical protein
MSGTPAINSYNIARNERTLPAAFNYGARWTEEDDELLRAFLYLPRAELAALIGRSYWGIRRRISKIGP